MAVQKPTRRAWNFKDCTGHRFGKLTVVKQLETRMKSAQWWVRCDCGIEKAVLRVSLRRSASCGCSKKTGKNSRGLYRMTTPSGLSARNKCFRHYQQAAKSRQLSWNISGKMFDVLTKADCHYCGTPPMTQLVISRNGSFLYNGIDRINNVLGYTPKNVVPCCPICNHAKHTMSYKTFMSWIKRLTQYQHERIQ
jgi:5-methylcytosine-specific restriction endonuclease McrA